MVMHDYGGRVGEVSAYWRAGRLKRCWHIRRGGYLIMMLDYKGGRGIKNMEKSDYVTREYF